MTVFLYSFPTKICKRIWDFFICEGIFSMIKLIIPIVNVFLDEFLEMDSIEVNYKSQL